jgi:hypothetical protein
VDSTLSSAREVEDQAISLNWVLVAAGGARKLSLIILDVGRENPVPTTNEDSRSAGGVSLGLGDVTLAVPNTLTAVAAKASSASYGGDGPNSPFMSALVKYIAQPGLDIRLALGKVHDEVLRATGNRQEPRIYGTLEGEEVTIVPPIPEARVAPAEATPAARLDEDLDYRIAQRIGSLEGWRSFLAAHGSGFHAQAARAEVDRLALAEKAPAPDAAEASNRASSDGKAAGEATGSPPSPGRSVTALAPVDICKRDEDRLAQLRAR